LPNGVGRQQRHGHALRSVQPHLWRMAAEPGRELRVVPDEQCGTPCARGAGCCGPHGPHLQQAADAVPLVGRLGQRIKQGQQLAAEVPPLRAACARAPMFAGCQWMRCSGSLSYLAVHRRTACSLCVACVSACWLIACGDTCTRCQVLSGALPDADARHGHFPAGAPPSAAAPRGTSHEQPGSASSTSRPTAASTPLRASSCRPRKWLSSLSASARGSASATPLRSARPACHAREPALPASAEHSHGRPELMTALLRSVRGRAAGRQGQIAMNSHLHQSRPMHKIGSSNNVHGTARA